MKTITVTYKPERKYVSITFDNTLICEFYNAIASTLFGVVHISVNNNLVTSLHNAELSKIN
jgi:hypothetical protein